MNTETEIVEMTRQAEQNIAGALNAYLREKRDWKQICDDIKKMETDAKSTADFLELKEKVKELNTQLSEMGDQTEKELKEDEDYNELRRLRLTHGEKVTKTRVKLEKKLEELPPEPVQTVLNLPDIEGETAVTINSRKHLFVNGKEEL